MKDILCVSYLSLVVLICCSEAAYGAAFDLACDGSAGYETGLYDSKDSSLKRSPFLSPSVEPSCIIPMSKLWHAEMQVPFSATLRPSIAYDLTIEPGLALVREWQKKALNIKAAAAYVKQPGTLDPNLPEENMQYKFSAEYGSRTAVTWKLGYYLSLLDELQTKRNDIKNKTRIKLGFKPADWFMPGVSAGAGWNVSNIKDYSYKELNLSLNSSIFPGERNMITVMVYWTLQKYPKNGLKSKVKNTTPDNKTYYTVLMLSYSRTVSDRFDIETSYEYSLYTAGGDDSSTGSHKVYMGLSWRLNPL